MTSITFKYNLQKDVENFIKGLNSVNLKTPTVLQEEYMNLHIEEMDADNLEIFLHNKGEGVDFDSVIRKIEIEWRPIESIFIQRCEELFGVTISEKVIGYMSLNQRCTYNWRENYFFIYADSKNSLKTIMHELLHFYTHTKYGELNIDTKKFNDIKESLTVLLNTEYMDLMGEAEDGGYEQHQEMRKQIVEMRNEGKSIDEIFTVLSK